ncbi:MAG: 5'-nucleotidase C-terminal domain-containing protein [Deltaproteobacteria bacterium]|nr:5'-nucleotidase C-terminal domain-containing protein [Deltaproteobacteria bacterium]
MKNSNPLGRLVLFSLLSLSIGIVLSCSAPTWTQPDGRAGVHSLVVLHTNDHHGHPLRFFHYPAPDVGGLPARATLVKKIRSENANVLVLDAGDLNTGRAESSFFKSEPDILGYNAIGYDAMAVGNHEFDNPIEVLRGQMKTARFPFLSANVKTSKGMPLARPYIIKSFNGLKAAVFGLTTTDTREIGNPRNITGILFDDEVETAKKLVPKLRKKADVVIALVHMGIYEGNDRGSKRLASNVDGIDLIVDGHTHTKLDSPLIIENRETGHRTYIVQAWQWGLIVGRVDLRIQDRKIKELRFKPIPVNLKRAKTTANGKKVFSFIGDPIEEDPALLALLEPYERKFFALLSEVIGVSEGVFSDQDVRRRETPLGDMIADSLAWYTRNLSVDFAILNGGGIRAELPEGDITKGRIYEILPFDDSLVVLTLKGKDVRALFEYIAAIPEGQGAFPQVSGALTFTIDRETGRCEDITINGRALDPQKTYRIATNSYLARGGDGYKMFQNALERYETSMFQRDVLIEYIRFIGGVIRPGSGDRIRIKGAGHAVMELDRAA